MAGAAQPAQDSHVARSGLAVTCGSAEPTGLIASTSSDRRLDTAFPSPRPTAPSPDRVPQQGRSQRIRPARSPLLLRGVGAVAAAGPAALASLAQRACGEHQVARGRIDVGLLAGLVRQAARTKASLVGGGEAVEHAGGNRDGRAPAGSRLRAEGSAGEAAPAEWATPRVTTHLPTTSWRRQRADRTHPATHRWRMRLDRSGLATTAPGSVLGRKRVVQVDDHLVVALVPHGVPHGRHRAVVAGLRPPRIRSADGGFAQHRRHDPFVAVDPAVVRVLGRDERPPQRE